MWLPDLGELTALVAGGARLVAINNPNNPTGSLMDRALLEQIVAIRAQVGAWLLCDEVYRGIDQQDPGTTSFGGRPLRPGHQHRLDVEGLLPGWVTSGMGRGLAGPHPSVVGAARLQDHQCGHGR